MRIVADTFNELYRAALRNVYHCGERVSPRGLCTREVRGATLVLRDLRYNLLDSPARGLNWCFSVAEWLWILTGRNDVEFISHFVQGIDRFSDDGLTFRGAYGPKVVEQLPYVVEALREDPDTRQALLTIWREVPRASKDVPCTISWQFFQRGGCLELDVYMRSNDAWLGLPYDVFNFSQTQRALARHLDLRPGQYRHHVGSLHLYDGRPEPARLLRVVNEEGYRDYQAPAPTWPVPGSVRLAAEAAQQDDPRGESYDVPGAWQPYVDVLRYRNDRDRSRVRGVFQHLLREE